jgi:hypothetical protein
MAQGETLAQDVLLVIPASGRLPRQGNAGQVELRRLNP